MPIDDSPFADPRDTLRQMEADTCADVRDLLKDCHTSITASLKAITTKLSAGGERDADFFADLVSRLLFERDRIDRALSIITAPEADTCAEEQRETTPEFRAGIQTGLLEAALGCCWALFGGLILLAVAGIVFVAVYP